MQIKLELFSPEILLLWQNKEPLDHLRVYGKSAASAQMDGRIGRTVTRKYHRAEESLILTSKIVILAYNPFFQESL